MLRCQWRRAGQLDRGEALIIAATSNIATAQFVLVRRAKHESRSCFTTVFPPQAASTRKKSPHQASDVACAALG
jgi:hypothetical protein